MDSENAYQKMLTAHLDSVFYGKAWHGASLLGTIRRLDSKQAILENREGFSPWKILLHCAYWKFDVRRALSQSAEQPTFPRKPRDFPRLPDVPDEQAWRADKEFLEEQHIALRNVVESFPTELLDEVPPKRSFTYAGLVLGAASHDVYHTAHIRNLGVVLF
ncbi:MAG TPA: DinB family protein [Spirochaetia bacterium]|nr:DinB family protein [Spirochaetia bacterium]